MFFNLWVEIRLDLYIYIYYNFGVYSYGLYIGWTMNHRDLFHIAV